MAELSLTAFLTLDGVIQAPGGPTEDPSGDFNCGGWLVPHFDEGFGATMSEIFSKAGAFLLGRKTYDIFSAHWPNVKDPDDPVASKLNALPKFVASRTQSCFAWEGSEHVKDVPAGVAELKAHFSDEIQVHGSSDLAQTLIQNDLIDEYRLLIFPVVLGKGNRLFGSGTIPANLSLVNSHSTKAGIVISSYRRGGDFKTGTVELA